MQSKDTYLCITDAVIEQLKAGTKSLVRPWRGTVRYANGEAYPGVCAIMLWLSSEFAGYND